jgi:hypothetical protein
LEEARVLKAGRVGLEVDEADVVEVSFWVDFGWVVDDDIVVEIWTD